jgi:hypothetical protein
MTTLLGTTDIDDVSFISASETTTFDFFLDSDFEPFFLFVAEGAGSAVVAGTDDPEEAVDDVDAVVVGVFARPLATRFFGEGSETPL